MFDFLRELSDFFSPEDHLVRDSDGGLMLVDIKARRHLEYFLCAGSAGVALGCSAMTIKSFMADPTETKQQANQPSNRKNTVQLNR
jgi:hypothetical protein